MTGEVTATFPGFQGFPGAVGTLQSILNQLALLLNKPHKNFQIWLCFPRFE